jgi:hypothetical protein
LLHPGKGEKKISDVQTLFWVVIAGVAVGFCFDAYRTFRFWRGWGPSWTFITDLLFSLGALGLLLFFFTKANALAFRFYMLWGSLLGLFLYLWVCSSWVTRGFFWGFKGLSWIRRWLIRLLKIPIRGITLLLCPFYWSVRWLAWLIYRWSEALIGWPLRRTGSKVVLGLKALFFPRTNG